uniref:Uncharacterized protein n=1 Tax=Anopheles melas TaxID=34690 RepID=A0A182TLR2_9DIPT
MFSTSSAQVLSTSSPDRRAMNIRHASVCPMSSFVMRFLRYSTGVVASTLSDGNTMSRFCWTPPLPAGGKFGPACCTWPPLPCTVGCVLTATAGEAFGTGVAPGVPAALPTLPATEGTPLPGTTTPPPGEGTTGGPPLTGTTGPPAAPGAAPGGPPTTPGGCGGVLMLADGIPGIVPGGAGTPGPPAPAIGGYGLPPRIGGRIGEFCDGNDSHPRSLPTDREHRADHRAGHQHRADRADRSAGDHCAPTAAGGSAEDTDHGIVHQDLPAIHLL